MPELWRISYVADPTTEGEYLVKGKPEKVYLTAKGASVMLEQAKKEVSLGHPPRHVHSLRELAKYGFHLQVEEETKVAKKQREPKPVSIEEESTKNGLVSIEEETTEKKPVKRTYKRTTRAKK